MVLVNTSRGETFSFDLSLSEDTFALQNLFTREKVTALSLVHCGTRYALPLPRRFRRPLFGAEPIVKHGEIIGERIFVQADPVRLNLSSLFSSNIIRADLVLTGSLRYYPGGV